MKIQELEKVSNQLSNFVEGFVDSFGRPEQRHWCMVYLSGLILDVPTLPALVAP